MTASTATPVSHAVHMPPQGSAVPASSITTHHAPSTAIAARATHRDTVPIADQQRTIPEQNIHHVAMNQTPRSHPVKGRTMEATPKVTAAVCTKRLWPVDSAVPARGFLPLTAAMVLFAYGLAALATLAGEVSSGLRSRGALASLIIAPLSLPLVMGASQTVAAIGRDTGILSWSLLLLATDLALTVVGVAVAGPLEEART